MTVDKVLKNAIDKAEDAITTAKAITLAATTIIKQTVKQMIMKNKERQRKTKNEKESQK